MSKQAKKRVAIKPKRDIIDGCWYHKGVYQKKLSKRDIEKINRFTLSDKYVTMRIINQLKKE